MKKFGFFSLSEIFIGNGMGKWGGEINLNTFGNMAHLSGAGTHWILHFWIVQFKTFKIQASRLCFKPQALSVRPLASISCKKLSGNIYLSLSSSVTL